MEITQGYLITLGISALSVVFSGVLALFLFLTMQSNRTRWISVLYEHVFRNTPLLIQLYVFQAVFAAGGWILPPWVSGGLSLTFYQAAYVVQILWGGYQSLPEAQHWSAQSLGFSPVDRLFRILLPQTLQQSMPALANQTISLVKNSAVVSFISVPDLFLVLYRQSAESFQYVQCYAIGVVLYTVTALAIGFLFLRLEKRWAFPWQGVS